VAATAALARSEAGSGAVVAGYRALALGSC
jgi:hypothetical protein